MSETTAEVTRFPKITNRSVEASKLIDFLKDKPETTEVTYGELSEVAGCRVDSKASKGWAALTSARRYLEATHGYVWETVYKAKRLRRLVVGERVATVDRNMIQIGRKVRRTARRVGTVDPATLPAAERTTFLVTVSHVAALGMSVGATARRKIEVKNAYTAEEALKALVG
jgi:hypothetical protein